jgi:hypothetical protein
MLGYNTKEDDDMRLGNEMDLSQLPCSLAMPYEPSSHGPDLDENGNPVPSFQKTR